MLDNSFKSNDNSEQTNTSDNNTNQGPHLDKKDFVLSPRRNNPSRVPDDTASMVEFDLMQSSPHPKPVANDTVLANSAN